MNEKQLKALSNDSDGLECYEFIANNIDSLSSDNLNRVIEFMRDADSSGQFLASAARYLHAIDKDAYRQQIKNLVADTIDKDREHKYLPQLLTSLYGKDCLEQSSHLCATDENFRRIYKRLYPQINKI